MNREYFVDMAEFKQHGVKLLLLNCVREWMQHGKSSFCEQSKKNPKVFQNSGEQLCHFFDPDDKTSGFGLSGDHGPKPSEVYGFVGSITTVVATVTFLIWAYVPESWLQSVGISYYPSRYWALAVPTYVMVTIVLMLGFYIGLNFISTPSPASLNTVFDEFNRDPLSLECSLQEDEKPIDPISDIGIDRINDIMFNSAT